MEVKTFACDICGIHKKDANHWWKVYRVVGGAVIAEWDDEKLNFEGELDYVDGGLAHLCGSNHVIEWLSKNIFK